MSFAFDAEIIRQKGWRQGSILEDIAHVAPNSSTDAIAILLSHDCDIVQSSLEKEPAVEILIAVPTAGLDGNYTRGKNARCYHFNLDGKSYEIKAVDRVVVSRQLLIDAEPSTSQLPADEVNGIVHWFAQRYERPAFPDNFNKRLSRKTRQVIERILKESGHLISGIYIACPHEELPDLTPYEITLYVVMTVKDYGDIEKAGECEDMAQLILDAINEQSQGIRIINSEDMCISEKELSLHDLRTVKRFTSFDHLSFGSDAAIEDHGISD